MSEEIRAIYYGKEWEKIIKCDDCPCYISDFFECGLNCNIEIDIDEAISKVNAKCDLPLYDDVRPHTPDEKPKATKLDPEIRRPFLLNLIWNEYNGKSYQIANWNGESWYFDKLLPGQAEEWKIMSWQELPDEWNRS